MKGVDAPMSANKQANRLIYEKSPYLLQHAHNPVDWYTWGPEAFARRLVKTSQYSPVSDTQPVI